MNAISEAVSFREPAALRGLLSRASRNSDRVIVPLNDAALEGGHGVPAFYCVHALSGAGGSDFADLARLMPKVGFFGIQAPPKMMSDAAFGDSIKSVAGRYADDLARFQPEGPFLLGGWSAGASIALEMAQILSRVHHREVSLLVAFDAAPENSAAGRSAWHPAYLVDLARNLPLWAAHEGMFRAGYFRSIARQMAHKVMACGETAVARARGEPASTGHAVEGFMDLSRYPTSQRSFMTRLYHAVLRYKPEPYTGRVLVYEAGVKPLYHLPQVGRVWRNIAQTTEIMCIDGTTHLSILREPCVRILAADLQARIAAVGARLA
jgi:thioesterase domain-containing protein